MKRIRKNKKILRLFLIVLLIIGICYISYKLLFNHKEDNSVNIEAIIDEIITKINNQDIDEDFLLWINDNYGQDTIINLNNTLDKNDYSIDKWHDITGNSYIVLKDLYLNKYDDMDNIKVLDTKKENTISFVGDVSLADNWYIMPKYDERGKGIYGILSEDIVKIMTDSDIMVANSEFTVSDRGEKMPNKYYTFRGSPKRLPIYNEMGVDLLTLANNHVYDFGKTAFYDMIDSLNEYKIPYIGAGKNISEAMRPYYFVIGGYKIAFVNATRAEKYILTPEATETEGGVFRCYDPTNLINLIKSTKEESDYVITLIHWGKEDSHDLEDVQVTTSKMYIDAGSDMIIGSHAHVLQGIEFYNDKPIIYNLGDFIFNDETKDTGIFQVKINDNKFEYYFIPALEKNEYTGLLKDEEKQRVINDLNSWSINTIIDSEGKIKSTN